MAIGYGLAGIGGMLVQGTQSDDRADAREQGCARLVLDKGLANNFVPRFYFRWDMLAGCMHFGKALT
jgi:hypothetical protein